MGTSNKYANYGITIEGDEQYRFAVELALRNIAASYTGRVLLTSIKSTGKSIQIIPWTDSTKCNAETTTDGPDATPSNQYVLKGGRSFQPRDDISFANFLVRGPLGLPLEPMQGTGKGSDATITFTPTMWGFGAQGPCSKSNGGPGTSPSLVLFHELAHAYRDARGRSFPRPTIGTSRSYDNMEEFFAVVLTNVLATDPTFMTGNRTLRADHSPLPIPLAANLSTSQSFVAHVPNRNMIRELVASEPALVSQLRGSKSTFNPFIEPLSGTNPGNDGETYKVVQGDSLSGIAKKFYGDEELWPIIYDKNHAKIGPNPDRISVGQSLSVPAKQALTPEQIKQAKETFRRSLHRGATVLPMR